MRVVFDSNIFISAFILPGSSAEKAIHKIMDSDDVLLLSKPIVDEILSVLSSKFSRDREELSHTAFFLSELGEVVTPQKKLNVLKDEPDNRILECALSGSADLIVTGDKEILRLGEYGRTKIISLKEFLEMD